MSSFAANHVQSIITASHSDVSSEENRIDDSARTQSLESERLYSMLVNLKDPLDHDAVRQTLEDLSDDSSLVATGSGAQEDDQLFLKRMLEERILVGMYARSLDLCLQEATEADTEADWWTNIERSWKSVAFYLFASESLEAKCVFSWSDSDFAQRCQCVCREPYALLSKSFEPGIFH